MKRCFYNATMLLIFVLSSSEFSYSWKETTHANSLTPAAVMLVLKINNDHFRSEINLYKSLIIQGSYDEDFPFKYKIIKLNFIIFSVPLDIRTYLRSNNHYRHAISGSVLTGAPLIGMGDPDVDALTWAKTNPFDSFSKEEEYGDDQWWAIKNKVFSAKEMDDGNMSWQKAINRYGYTDHSKKLAYYTLGFVIHLLQDMGEPEHVHDDPHGGSGYTGFEKWVEVNWGRIAPNFVPKMDTLRPKRFGKDENIDTFFNNLAEIAYSADRFSLQLYRPNPFRDLAVMFKISYGWLDNSWCLDNYRLFPIKDSEERSYYFSPPDFKYDPFSHKGNVGDWWPTHLEMSKGKNDVEGYYYIELSDELPPPLPSLERYLYPKAYLPTPLPSVADQCQEWKVKKCLPRTHLYQLIGERVFPKTIEHTAGLLEHYYEIVNHPPHVKQVKVSQKGEDKYLAFWEDAQQGEYPQNSPEKSESNGPLRSETKNVQERYLRVTKDNAIDPGNLTVEVEFSEPVREVSIHLDNQTRDGILTKESGEKVWFAEFGIQADLLQTDKPKLPISIIARDKDNHYDDIGGWLDPKPETLARRKCLGSDSLSYDWEGYEYEEESDAHYEISIKKDSYLIVHVQDNEDVPIKDALVNVQFHRGEEQQKRRGELQKNILLGKELKEEEKKELRDLSRAAGEKVARTDSRGDARVELMPGLVVVVKASATGYKDGSMSERIEAPPSRITLALSPEEKSDKLFFLDVYNIDQNVGRFYGPRVNLWSWPWPAKPGDSTIYPAELRYVPANEVKALYARLRDSGDKKADLPFPEILRSVGYNRIFRLTEDYVIAIECNGQTRYRYTAFHKDLTQPGGALLPHEWGGGEYYGLGAGRHECKVTAFNSEGKLAEFTMSFIVEQDPGIDQNEVREKLQEARDKAKDALEGLANAGSDPEKQSEEAYRYAAWRYSTISIWHKYLPGTPEQIMSQFNSVMRAWEDSLRAKLRAGVRSISAYSLPYELCWRVCTPPAFAEFERALGLVEQNAEALQVSLYSLAGAHERAAHLAIASSNNIEAARRHLERRLELLKAFGEKIDEEKERKSWPKVWRSGKDRPVSSSGVEEGKL